MVNINIAQVRGFRLFPAGYLSAKILVESKSVETKSHEC